ncbi:DgyrCDS506 [Dimorphilus gyrociliatus]|nr:DgyrCDS506 [Dimorphilus gyrociliatus]
MHVRKYPCMFPGCQHAAQTKSNLRRHEATHSNIRPYICEICQQAFRQKIHLQRHTNYKHSNERIKCEYCDYLAANADSDLSTHMKRCHPVEDARKKGLEPPELQCPQCYSTFTSKKDLQNHAKFHRTQGPELKFSCPHCSFVTDASSRLQRHLVIHTGEKRFGCSLCEYKANQKEHVLRHMCVVHNVEKATKKKRNDEPRKKYPPSCTASLNKVLACNRCDMTFARTLSLYRHVKEQHDMSMVDACGAHTCVACDYSAPTYKALVSHMRKHNDPPPQESEVTNVELNMSELADDVDEVVVDGNSLYRESEDGRVMFIKTGDGDEDISSSVQVFMTVK